MKVLFVMKYPLTREYSVLQKFNGEMNAVRKLGHKVSYISFDEHYLYLNDENGKKRIKATTFGKSKLYYHTLVFSDLYSATMKVLKNHHFDMVYFRYSPIGIKGYRMMKMASKVTKVVVEIPTFPPSREKQKGVARQVYMTFSYAMWKRSARFITLFTGIGESAKEYLGVPFINIDNGVDVGLIPLRHPKKDGKIHLLAVASMAKWHGYDRIIKGLSQWNNSELKNTVIDLVGGEGDGSLEEWRRLAKASDVEEQVVFHGVKTGDELTALFDKATIGIGSLGLYRNGINNGSILKIREYAARGLPFIYAHNDPHIPSDAAWCLKFSNDDTPIDMDKVYAFILSISDIEKVGNNMREYAEEYMSWEAQFKLVFCAIE
ncbi:MAG: hypothetical protein IKZ90_04250 [Clostridiales bacterium]|nr:hypothetical protein [Clostridiales bacterium]